MNMQPLTTNSYYDKILDSLSWPEITTGASTTIDTSQLAKMFPSYGHYSNIKSRYNKTQVENALRVAVKEYFDTKSQLASTDSEMADLTGLTSI